MQKKQVFLIHLLLLPLFSLINIALWAQIQNPVKWKFNVVKTNEQEALLIIKATIEKGWHLYSQQVVEDGPIPTSISYTPNTNYELIDKTQESKPIKHVEPAFNNALLSYFENSAVFKQKIKIKSAGKLVITGSLEYMTCNDMMCSPPTTIDFVFNIEERTPLDQSQSVPVVKESLTTTSPIIPIEKTLPADTSPAPRADKAGSITSAETDEEQKIETESLWNIFLKGFAGGFVALITPCVYSMIPLTVAFFTKRGSSRRKGIQKALWYGLFIVAIYVALALLLTAIAGPDALNALASNVWMNLFFFAIFMVFAFSFLGAFEITLPSSWVNKTDSASDKGGIMGIFFMAFTLVLVSFSCTGPIVGSLLPLISKGTYLSPAVGMAGFGLSLALPFVLFALFPGWLNAMPKSGGWLNAVKVVLGLLEIALALKFLSNADMVAGWYLITRELFIAIWIVVFAVMGFYLLGKLKFSHDSDVPYLGVTRTMLAILVLSFTIYLIPGLWGAPLKLIGGFPPPATANWSENLNHFKSKTSAAGSSTGPAPLIKGVHRESCPNDLNCFHDYNEALAYAKQVNKPILIDFTGWTCLNCRKMEQNVWPIPEVLTQLQNDYVLVSLYVDERTKLPVDSQFVSKHTGNKITTTGNKWGELQTVKYNTNTLPYYVLVDHEGKSLTKPKGYTPDVAEYVAFLKKGTEEFKRRTKK